MLTLLISSLAVLIPPVQQGAPNRQPALAVSSKYVAAVFGSGTSVWYLRSLDRGKTFSTPQKIADVPALMLGRHRGPRIAIRGNSFVVTAISGGDRGDLLSWHSVDGGETWSHEPIVINDKAHAAREGLHNLAVTSDGVFGAIWLDLRSKGTRLYGSFTRDGGLTWQRNVAIFENEGGTICTCCHPSIAGGPAGSFVILFRNVADGNRDMYSLRWLPGQAPSGAVKQGSLSWNINACPMDGGGIAMEGSGIESAWRRDQSIVLASENGKESILGEGKDPAIAASSKGTVVVWTSKDGAIVGKTGTAKELRVLGSRGAFPTLASDTHNVVAAWENGEAIALEPLAP